MGSIPRGISASRGAAVLGLSTWTTPVEVWLRIMEERSPGFCKAHGYEEPEEIEGAPLRWGLYFENAIRERSEYGANMLILPDSVEQAFEHPDADFVTCHVDGLFEDGTVHEAKTTSAFYFRDNFGEPGSDRVPKNYQIQVQHQMMTAVREKATLSVLVFPNRVDSYEEAGLDLGVVDPFVWTAVLSQMNCFHQYPIAFDPELAAAMLSAYRDFWEVHVLGETPPEPEKYSDVRKLVTAPQGTIVADEQIERLASEYRVINEENKATNKRKDQLKTLILTYMSRNAEVNIDDDSVEKWILRDRSGKKLHQFDGKRFR